MELGNLTFGCSRGPYGVPRGSGWENEFDRLLNKLEHMGLSYDDFENDVFLISSYYWGDCTCGYDDKEYEWCNNNHHADDCYREDYYRLEKELDEKYGSHLSLPDNIHKKYVERVIELYKKHSLEYNKNNPLQGCAIRCSCDYHKKWSEFCSLNHHSVDCMLVQPNFKYKPDDFTIDWYKYYFRDSYMNKKYTLNDFKLVIDNCITSLED